MIKIYKARTRILFCLVCFLLADPVLAVDGYKQFKFGTSLEDIKKTNICAWNDALAPKYQHVRSLYCSDFKFNAKTTWAVFLFIDDKFLRLVINIPYAQRDSILAVLKKKYGGMSSPSDEDIKKFNSSPNQELWYNFDKNTISLAFYSNNRYVKSANLFYESPIYNKLWDEKQAKSLTDDL